MWPRKQAKKRKKQLPEKGLLAEVVYHFGYPPADKNESPAPLGAHGNNKKTVLYYLFKGNLPLLTYDRTFIESSAPQIHLIGHEAVYMFAEVKGAAAPGSEKEKRKVKAEGYLQKKLQALGLNINQFPDRRDLNLLFYKNTVKKYAGWYGIKKFWYSPLVWLNSRYNPLKQLEYYVNLLDEARLIYFQKDLAEGEAPDWNVMIPHFFAGAATKFLCFLVYSFSRIGPVARENPITFTVTTLIMLGLIVTAIFFPLAFPVALNFMLHVPTILGHFHVTSHLALMIMGTAKALVVGCAMTQAFSGIYHFFTDLKLIFTGDKRQLRLKKKVLAGTTQAQDTSGEDLEARALEQLGPLETQEIKPASTATVITKEITPPSSPMHQNVTIQLDDIEQAPDLNNNNNNNDVDSNIYSAAAKGPALAPQTIPDGFGIEIVVEHQSPPPEPVLDTIDLSTIYDTDSTGDTSNDDKEMIDNMMVDLSAALPQANSNVTRTTRNSVWFRDEAPAQTRARSDGIDTQHRNRGISFSLLFRQLTNIAGADMPVNVNIVDNTHLQELDVLADAISNNTVLNNYNNVINPNNNNKTTTTTTTLTPIIKI